MKIGLVADYALGFSRNYSLLASSLSPKLDSPGTGWRKLQCLGLRSDEIGGHKDENENQSCILFSDILLQSERLRHRASGIGHLAHQKLRFFLHHHDVC